MRQVTYTLAHPLINPPVLAVDIRSPSEVDLSSLQRDEGDLPVTLSDLLALMVGQPADVFALLSGNDVAEITTLAEKTFEVDLMAILGRALVVPAMVPKQGEPQVVQPSVVIDRASIAARSHRLVYPFRVNGKWLRSVTVRIPLQHDIDDWAEGRLKTPRDMMLRLTGLQAEVAKALAWCDSEVVHLIVQDLLPDFLTGEGE